MLTFLIVVGTFAIVLALAYFIIWAMVRASEAKGRAEATEAIRAEQVKDAHRRLSNALDADAKSRADSATDGLYNDDGHRRD